MYILVHRETGTILDPHDCVYVINVDNVDLPTGVDPYEYIEQNSRHVCFDYGALLTELTDIFDND